MFSAIEKSHSNTAATTSPWTSNLYLHGKTIKISTWNKNEVCNFVMTSFSSEVSIADAFKFILLMSWNGNIDARNHICKVSSVCSYLIKSNSVLFLFYRVFSHFKDVSIQFYSCICNLGYEWKLNGCIQRLVS